MSVHIFIISSLAPAKTECRSQPKFEVCRSVHRFHEMTSAHSSCIFTFCSQVGNADIGTHFLQGRVVSEYQGHTDQGRVANRNSSPLFVATPGDEQVLCRGLWLVMIRRVQYKSPAVGSYGAQGEYYPQLCHRDGPWMSDSASTDHFPFQSLSRMQSLVPCVYEMLLFPY